MTIQGPLQPKNIEVSGSLSSQFLTGLLFAYSAAPNPILTEADEMMNNNLSETVCIKVHDLKSKPYIDLTLDVMKNSEWISTSLIKIMKHFVFTGKREWKGIVEESFIWLKVTGVAQLSY